MQEENVQVSIDFMVPASIVFDAWLNKEMLRKWMFGSPGSEITEVQLTPEVDGTFSILERDISSDEYTDHTGKYIVIASPKELQFSLSGPGQLGENIVTVIIHETGSGCRLTLTQLGVANEVSQRNWKNMLEQLRLSLENQ